MSSNLPFFIGIAGSNDELTPEVAGSKATELWRMSRLGLSVPPAFVLPTTLCEPVNRQDPKALAALDHGLWIGVE